MFIEYRRRPDRALLAIQLLVRSEGGDRFDRGEILPDRDRQASAIKAWQAEQALYHAVRFHEGTE